VVPQKLHQRVAYLKSGFIHEVLLNLDAETLQKIQLFCHKFKVLKSFQVSLILFEHVKILAMTAIIVAEGGQNLKGSTKILTM